jgi:aminopeptidase N
MKNHGTFSIIAILLIFLIQFSCGRTRSFYHEGVSQELARYRAKQIYDVHYVIDFHIPEEKDLPVRGSVEVHFKPLKARHGMILDFQPGPEFIHELKVNGEKSPYNAMNGHIYIDANGLVPRQNNIIEIVITSSDQALNRSEEFMYTLFVPDRASTAFPCFDQPDIKATFDLTLTIPENWTALSNGPNSLDSIADNSRIMKFSSGKPISTYLFAFTAGIFNVLTESNNGRTIQIFHRETDQDKINRNAEIIFSQHFSALNWLEDYTGIPYPYEKFDMAILPGFQYSGMEHPGAIWYRDARLLLDKDPSITRQISQASLIAHETAHMWFGNLVTMEWFDDVWLKEVFAGFFADKIVDEVFPGVNHTLRFLLTHYPRAYSVDRTKGTHPIKQELNNMNMAGTLYGPIIYNKAPIVFVQLEKIMGELNFRDAVREYLTVFYHGNADWNDLVRILDKYSSNDINHWSDAWIYGKGMPEIEYFLKKSDSEKIAAMTLELTGEFNPRRFPLQFLAVTLLFRDSLVEHLFRMDRSPSSFILELETENPEMILLNGGGLGYGYFRMTEADIEHALNNAVKIENEIFKVALFINMHENFLNGSVNKEDYFNFLTRSLEKEQDQQIQNYLVLNLVQMCHNFLDYENSDFYKETTENLLWQMFLDSPTPAKELFFETWLKLSRSEKSISIMKSIYQGTIKIENYSLSEQNLTNLLCELVIRNPHYNYLIQIEIDRIENPDRKRRLKFISPALEQDKTIRDQFFAGLLLAENRNPEPWVLDALYYLHHPLHAEQGLDYIPQSLQILSEIQRTGDIFFPQNWLIATLQNYSNPVVADMVREYLDQNPGLSENLRKKVLQASDIIFRSVEMKE